MSETKPRSHTVEEIFAAARSHVFYRDFLQQAGSFADCPITDKKTLYPKVMTAFEQPEFTQSIYVSPTSGSVSNQLLFFPTDIDENKYQRAVLSRFLSDAGIFTPQTVAINLMPSTLMYRALEIFNDFCELCCATTLPCPPPSPYDDIYKIACLFRANTIIGFPSRLMAFARFVSKNQLPIEIEHAIFAGEPFPPQRRKYLQDTLHVQRFSGIFGSAEAGIWGYKPPDLDGDRYLFPAELMHVELTDINADGFGSMVLTNLVRKRNPLLRYNSGDIARLSRTTYRGAQVNLLELKGRVSTSFDIGGDYFALDDFGELFAGMFEFQIQLSYQEEQKRDQVNFLLVAPEEVDERQRAALVSKVRQFVNSNDDLFITRVSFVDSESLHRSATSHKIVKILDMRTTAADPLISHSATGQ